MANATKPASTPKTESPKTEAPKTEAPADKGGKLQFQANADQLAKVEAIRVAYSKKVGIDMTTAQVVRTMFLRGFDAMCAEAGVK